MSAAKIESKSAPVTAPASAPAAPAHPPAHPPAHAAPKVEAAATSAKPVAPVTAPVPVVATAPIAAAVSASAPAASTPAKATLSPLAANIAALRDPSADKAREAAEDLGKLGDPAALAPLVEVVTNPNGYFHSVVRAAACASLGLLKDRRATDALVSAIRDPMAEASAEAVRALAKIADERAVEPLTQVLRNERGYYLPVVRLAAIQALRQFKLPQASAALKAVASNPAEDAVLRSAAA